MNKCETSSHDSWTQMLGPGAQYLSMKNKTATKSQKVENCEDNTLYFSTPKLKKRRLNKEMNRDLRENNSSF